jgi:hypothetical protein
MAKTHQKTTNIEVVVFVQYALHSAVEFVSCRAKEKEPEGSTTHSGREDVMIITI